MKFLGISGSLRAGSYNTLALKAWQEMLPNGTTLEIAPIGTIALYNAEIEVSGGLPEVQELKQKIRSADAVIIASPEYNYSVSGVLKNAIDWVSRPPKESPWFGKPVGILGASTGLLGTARAQAHLRQILHAVNCFVLNRPEILISGAKDKFDDQGTLIDEATRQRLTAFLVALKHWAERVPFP